MPQVIGSLGENETFRCWTAGCASGEETYSLAMLLAEALGQHEYRRRVKIYATDVDEEALAHARQAIYTGESLAPRTCGGCGWMRSPAGRS